ncbi:hypothetical protein J7L67_03440 [bacterium]|nr:hypothetical protein [bacterium]
MNEPKIKKNRRSLWLIDKDIQMKFMALLTIIVLLNSILFLGVVWYTLNLTAVATSEVTVRQQITVLLISFLIVILNLGFVIYLGLVTSHRFMGPLYKLKKSIDELVKGSYGGNISFREKDLKFRLANVYNELSAALEQRVEEDLFFADKLKEKIRGGANEISGRTPAFLKEIELELDNFKKSKSQFLEK